MTAKSTVLSYKQEEPYLDIAKAKTSLSILFSNKLEWVSGNMHMKHRGKRKIPQVPEYAKRKK
jgi:hypothetical protein